MSSAVGVLGSHIEQEHIYLSHPGNVCVRVGEQFNYFQMTVFACHHQRRAPGLLREGDKVKRGWSEGEE